MSEIVNLHPLYAQEYWQLIAFFEKDPTIHVGPVNDDEKKCIITCKDPLKGYILGKFLNLIELVVEIQVEDDTALNDYEFAYLCKQNPLFHDLVDVTVKAKAIEMAPVCTHYYSDDMFSPTGHTAILPYQLARNLFRDNGLNFQTHLE